MRQDSVSFLLLLCIDPLGQNTDLMPVFLSLLSVIAIVIVPFYTMVMLAIGCSNFRDRYKRRSCREQQLREPGHSLRQEIESLDNRFYGYILLLIVTPLYCYSAHLSQFYLVDWEEITFSILFTLLLAVVSITHAGFNIVGLAKERRNRRLGLEGEIAVGKMLAPLERDGARLFHDFQTGRFNINHVLVNRAGVFAIETKTHCKSTVADQSRAMKVVFDGKRLLFPEHSETEPVEQAKRLARWLARWLESYMGEPVPVQPVVAVPGWYVDLKGRYDVIVTNPEKPEFLARPKQGSPGLNLKQLNEIIFHLDHHCRDTLPVAEKTS